MPHGPLEIRQGANLPHWRRDGAAYAVTFRLADSLPADVLEGWRIEREHIIANANSLNRPLTEYELARLDALHSQRVEAWLDKGHGSCVLRDARFACLVREAIFHFDGERYHIDAWCVMPNHVHVVLDTFVGVELSKVVHSWKGFTGKKIQELLDQRGAGAVWQKEPYDHLIRNPEDRRRQIEYVLNNPARAGMSNWPWVGRGQLRGRIIPSDT